MSEYVPIVDGVPTSGFRCAIPNAKRYMKHNRWKLEDLAEAALEGNFGKLDTLLASGDEMNLFNGDLNLHLGATTLLHFAASSGHADCLELLLRARADPHIRERMPFGKDPEDGRTPLDYAREAGWDDCIELLKQAENAYSYGFYVPAGPWNNAKCYDCWEWDEKPERGWYMRRPGAAIKQGLDPKRYGASDFQEFDVLERSISQPRTPVAEPLPIGLLFPALGSQYLKMLEGVQDVQVVKDVLSRASGVLEYDVLKLCLHGPAEEFYRIDKAHAVMFVACAAALELLRQDRQEVVARCKAVAGLSSGEMSALYAAEVFSFEDGLRLASLLGKEIQVASKGANTMSLSVAGLEKAKLFELCERVRSEEGGDAICMVTQELFPKGFLCTGSAPAIVALKAEVENAGALQARTQRNVSVVHTPLAASAASTFAEACGKFLSRMKAPKCTVFLGSAGCQIKAGTPPKDFVDLLSKHLTSPVAWDTLLRSMIDDGISEFYEVGPMKQLKAMMKRTDPKVWNTTYNVEI